MGAKIIIDDIDRARWRQYAAGFADYSIYQTWAYQQVRAVTDGQKLSRVVVLDDNSNVMTMCQVRIKKVKPLGLAIGYVQWGPLFRSRDNAIKCTRQALRCIVEAYLGSRVNVLRVVPNAEANEVGSRFAAMLESTGFERVRGAEPYLTMMFSVQGTQEQIRNRLHRSWRRGLNKAEQNGLEVKEGSNPEYFDILEKMYTDAKQRKGFKGLESQEFAGTQRLLSTEEKMNVIIAYSDGQAVTSHASSHLGDTAVGALAASNEKGRQREASYLVWWRTFLAARRAGMKRYDLGGIDPKKNPQVCQFKQRMGAKEICYIGTYEICTSTAVKRLWRMAEKVYRLVKR